MIPGSVGSVPGDDGPAGVDGEGQPRRSGGDQDERHGDGSQLTDPLLPPLLRSGGPGYGLPRRRLDDVAYGVETVGAAVFEADAAANALCRVDVDVEAFVPVDRAYRTGRRVDDREAGGVALVVAVVASGDIVEIPDSVGIGGADHLIGRSVGRRIGPDGEVVPVVVPGVGYRGDGACEDALSAGRTGVGIDHGSAACESHGIPGAGLHAEAAAYAGVLANPERTSLPQETLGIRWRGFSPLFRYSYRHSHF